MQPARDLSFLQSVILFPFSCHFSLFCLQLYLQTKLRDCGPFVYTRFVLDWVSQGLAHSES